MNASFDIVILGLSITSSWGNGHATTYRGLIRGLADRGHRVLFLERDMPWYAGNRDEPHPLGAVTELYGGFEELSARFERQVTEAQLVIVGSYVPEGPRVGEWVTSVAQGVTAFYDIDTPVTVAQLESGKDEYITAALIPRYDMYLSFTGGPTLRFLEDRYGSPMARVFYCSVDPESYRPVRGRYRWDIGYLGTYSGDRQPLLETLLLEPARRWEKGSFIVAGPSYPASVEWPANVEYIAHLPPLEHPAFYGSQRFTLNVTRAEMKSAGFSPSVRLFEAGACGVPVISDWWEGLDSLFEPGKEVLISSSAEDTLRYLRDIPESRRLAIGEAARRRILAEHTPVRRARQLEIYLKEAHGNVSAHTPRRDRRRGESACGLDAGLASQQHREGPGGAADAAVVAPADYGGVHQPSGTSH